MSDTPNTTPNVKEESQVNSQQPQADANDSAPVKSEDMFTKDQMEEMLVKARQEEKAKLYKSIEKSKAQSDKMSAERDKVLEDLNQANERLKTLQDSNMSDIEKVNKQIELLVEQNELLKRKMETVSEQAENRVRQSEVSAYRQRRIEQSGLLFPEMVQGTTPEEIDASIEQLKSRESSVRTQLEDKMRAEQAVNVPRPMSPEGSAPAVSVKDRYKLSKLSRDDYQNVRQKLVANALDSIQR